MQLPAPVGQVEHQDLKEGSGLTRSHHRPDAFWAHNDSGHDPVLFLLNAKGEHLGALRIIGVDNTDWESVTVDAAGGIWIGDVGNNANNRKGLSVMRVVEPPAGALPEGLKIERRMFIRYPDQKEFPPEKNNFDCEAIFVSGDTMYFLTKHRADRDTKLYRLDLQTTEEEVTLELVQRFHEIGHVTGAELHPNGQRVAVLTFSGIWIFEIMDDRTLSKPTHTFLFENWALEQIEGIAWKDEETVMVTNEQRKIFHIPLKRFAKLSVKAGPCFGAP